ncbi:MAG TPA: hypothetical protein VGK41_05490 [Solirubrobacterales bacterium]
MPASASEQARERRVKKALANPVFFGEYYLRPFDPNWSTALPEFSHDMLRFIVRVKRGVVMLPVEMLKTTLGTQLYGLWRTYRSRVFKEQFRGMLMAEEQGMAAANLSVISWHIENNELLAADFVDADGRPLVRPSEREEKWNEEAIVIERDHPSKDPTWQAKGIDGKGIHGRRLDLFIGDDMITPRNAHSPTLRKQALDTFDLQVKTRLTANAQAIMLGNFNDAKDLLSTLGRRRRWETFKMPSFHLPGQRTVPTDEKDFYDRELAIPQWPENWPYERLIEDYEETPQRFMRVHQLDEEAERGEKLKVDWINEITAAETPIDDSRFILFWDPAGGGETHDLDYHNVTITAEHGAFLDIIGSMDFRADLPTAIDRLAGYFDRFNRVGNGVFAIGLSKLMLDNVMREAVGMKRPDLLPFLTPIPMQGSKDERLESLGPTAQSGYLRIWTDALHALTSDPEDQDQELSFLDQWRGFNGARHDDKLDGAYGAVRTAGEFAGVEDQVYDLEAH